MNTYLIERTNKETGKTRIEVVKAPFLAIAFLEQETEYGKGYTYRLAEHLKVSTVDDHNKEHKDRHGRICRHNQPPNKHQTSSPTKATPKRKDTSMKETPKWLTIFHKTRNLILDILIASLPLAAFLAFIRLIIRGIV